MPKYLTTTRQSGYLLIGIVVILLLAGTLFILTRYNNTAVREVELSGEAKDQVASVRDALIRFVGVNGYLPCPADGTLTTGLAVPAAATATCTTPNGVVPWATIGLSQKDALDPYQGMISYRVYSGATGLTQTSGATMANCDAVRAALPIPQPVGTDAAGRCRTDHDTSSAQFLAGKGLSITDSGTAVSGVAFVLISHGKNGAGAYHTDGNRTTLPAVASSEYGHTQANGPFVIKPGSDSSVAQSAVTYFDDSLSYLTITELTKRAQVAARDWPDPASTVLSSTTFTSANIAAAAAAAGSTPVGTSTNTTSLNVNGVTISSSGAAGVEISSLNGTSGFGIGVISATGTTGGNISGTDKLTFNFGTTAQKFGIMLVDFGSVFGQSERASLTFKNGAAVVGSATLLACRGGAVFASYSVDAGGTFDTVELTALTRVGSGSSSSFLLAELAICSASATTCATQSANAGTDCPYP